MNLCWANRLRGLALLMLLWGGQPAYAQEAAQAKPAAEVSPIVQAVRIVKQDGSVLSTNPPGLSVGVGAPLNRDQIAASIHTLYKTGDFANITAERVPQADGVRLDFVVQENLFINQVVILGLTPPPTEASASGPAVAALSNPSTPLPPSPETTTLPSPPASASVAVAPTPMWRGAQASPEMYSKGPHPGPDRAPREGGGPAQVMTAAPMAAIVKPAASDFPTPRRIIGASRV